MLLKALNIALLAGVLAITGCASRQHITERTTFAKQVMVFIPGYKGTVLREIASPKKIFWFTARDALFGTKRLIIDKHPELALDGVSEVEPIEVLRSIPIVPGIAQYNIYEHFLKRLRKQFEPDVQVIEFPYDWRQDNVQSAQKLAAFINDLEQNGAESISIVAHSMGGLIAAYYLRYGGADLEHATETWEGASHLRSVTFVATPFRGLMIAFHDINYGSTQGLNSAVLDATAFSSFPSVYELLPLDDSLLTFEALQANSSVFNFENWRNYRWGFLRDADKQTPAVREAREKYTADNLTRGKKFLEVLNAPLATRPKGSTIVSTYVGTSNKTLNRSYVPSDSKLRPDFDGSRLSGALAKSLSFTGDGDELVPSASATLPDAFTSAFSGERHTCKKTHLDVLQCVDFQTLLPIAREDKWGEGAAAPSEKTHLRAPFPRVVEPNSQSCQRIRRQLNRATPDPVLRRGALPYERPIGTFGRLRYAIIAADAALMTTAATP